MLQTRKGKAASFRLTSSILVGCAALLFVATTAQSQITRPSHSLYIALNGGYSLFYGDTDGFPDGNPTSAEAQLFDAFEDGGFYAGGELGYQFSPAFSVGLAYMYWDNPGLDEEHDLDSTFPGWPGTNVNVDRNAQVAQLLLRWLPFVRSPIGPYLELGGSFVMGQGTEAERNEGGENNDVFGFGPTVGLGLDIALSGQFSLLVSGQATPVFPDVALDGADPSAFGIAGDNADYDVLGRLGLGLRYAFRKPYTAVRIEDMQCPAELTAGESGSFAVMSNADATPPVSYTWDWGDGATGTGSSSSHAYAEPGEYTVTATAAGDYNSDTESCSVTVLEEPVALTACSATPSTVVTGETVEINGTLSGTEPIDVTVDFGDGNTGNSLPASHTYAETGTYTVTIEASNATGSDSCTTTVTVGDEFCAQVQELNSVFFDFNNATLTTEAESRLDENIEILERCPDINVEVRGYSDGVETNDPLDLSTQRAELTRDYYIANGIAEDRVTARGLGVDPDANPKEDPGRGDSRARRADSIPMDM